MTGRGKPGRWTGAGRAVGLWLTGLLLVSGSLQAKTPSPAVPAYQIEAAYLYNFARFIEWPEGSFARPDSPLVIGVLGKDPFGAVLDEMVKGENINGRAIVVRRFSREQEIADCHVLFIARSESDRVGQICSALKSRHILTVSEITDFAHRGGMIELVEEKERVRFRINLGRVRDDLLSVSAKLLQLAEVVFHFKHPNRSVAGLGRASPRGLRRPAGVFPGRNDLLTPL